MLAQRSWFLLVMVVSVVLGQATLASAAPSEGSKAGHNVATFAFIVGVNRSVDKDAPVLRYADDDAAKYLDLFRTLGARSYVLARLDQDTRRLHPQVAAEARPPRRAEYLKMVEALAADIRQARRQGVKTILYFAYAGHGNVERGRAYITLEDVRIDSKDLETSMLRKINADQDHLIVDACYSYLLALSRGPGGKRQKVEKGFSELGGLGARPSTGLLFSTSSAKESHEWAGFQAGVFSHEVRSGLYGAADANSDGRVSYREIAAFIKRANAGVANERYRPDVFARPPKNGSVLVDLTARRHARIELEGTPGGHHLLEDEHGIRYADFHNDANEKTYLIKPFADGALYLRRERDEQEVVIPKYPYVVEVASLTPQPAEVLDRGAAHHAFRSLFSLPFNQRVVQTYQFHIPTDAPPARVADHNGVPRDKPAHSSDGLGWQTYTGIGLVGAAALGAGAATYALVDAKQIENNSIDAPQPQLVRANERIRTRKTAAYIGYGAAGAFAITGLTLLLWPEDVPAPVVDVSTDHATMGIHGSF